MLHINTKWCDWWFSIAAQVQRSKQPFQFCLQDVDHDRTHWNLNGSLNLRGPADRGQRGTGCRNALEDRDWPPPNLIIDAWDLISSREQTKTYRQNYMLKCCESKDCTTWNANLERNFGPRSFSCWSTSSTATAQLHPTSTSGFSMGFSQKSWNNPPGQCGSILIFLTMFRWNRAENTHQNFCERNSTV